MTSHALYSWHHSHYIWHCIHCICVITSTVLMISHKLYFLDYFCYNSRHHIHCIGHDSHWLWHNTHSFDDIRTFLCMTSHPLYVQYHITYIRHHVHILWDHTTLYMTSHALFLDITPSISDTTSILSVSSWPVHQLFHTTSPYDITHTLCMKSQSVCMTSHEHFMIHTRIIMTSHTIYL